MRVLRRSAVLQPALHSWLTLPVALAVAQRYVNATMQSLAASVFLAPLPL